MSQAEKKSSGIREGLINVGIGLLALELAPLMSGLIVEGGLALGGLYKVYEGTNQVLSGLTSVMGLDIAA